MRILLSILVALTCNISVAQLQDIWAVKDSVNGPGRAGGAAFNCDGDGMVCGGKDDFSRTRKTYSYTLWQDDWDDETALGGSSFDALDRSGASGFSIGNKGYVCLGFGDFTNYFNDLWEYDGATNTWSQKANFPGSARHEAISFSIDNLGYVGTGEDENGLRKDMYVYDAITNHWEQVADFAGTARKEAVGFTMGSKGYVGTGDDGVYRNDFWEYNPTTDSWTQKANLPGVARKAAVGWGMFPQGFICTGENSSSQYLNDLWEYNHWTGAWEQRVDFMGSPRSNAICFVIDNLAFVGMGYDGTYYDDFYSYNRVLGLDDMGIIELSIFPNPASEMIQLKSDQTLEEIRIYDITGKELKRESVNNSSFHMNINELADGNYIIAVQLPNGQIHSKEFIKK